IDGSMSTGGYLAEQEAPAPPPPRQTYSFWRLLREGFVGTDLDLTHNDVPLKAAILLLAIPMTLEVGAEPLFGVLDMLFVSRSGASATAAVAVTEFVLLIISTIACGLGVATTAYVARRVGEKDLRSAARVA